MPRALPRVFSGGLPENAVRIEVRESSCGIMAHSGDKYCVDGHVHLQDGFGIDAVLSAAAGHFAAASATTGATPKGVLLLSEIAGTDRFAELLGTTGDWQFSETGEPQSRLAQRGPDGAQIAVVSGRQVISAEGLEVQALGTRAQFADETPLDQLLEEIPASGALAVLPWGVGKWSGRRGARIADLVAEGPTRPGLFLADSGVRPAALARPALLAQGEATGWRVLAGTDPLPLSGEDGKPGRFGFRVDGPFDPRRPFAALAAWLGALSMSPPTYGQLERPLTFLRQQVQMQLRKRLR